MCVIFTATPGHMPTMLEVAQMADHNPDGSGIAWYDPATESLKVRKFMDNNKMVGFIGTHYDELENVAVLCHFRIATHGSVNLTNCHPFRVSCGYMAHNGIARDYEHGPYASDSRNAIRAWDADHSVNLKGNGRFALITDDGEIEWIEGGERLRDGIMVSNRNWKPNTARRFSNYGYGYGSMYGGSGRSSYGNFNFAADADNVPLDGFEEVDLTDDTPTAASLASAGVTR